MGKPIVSREEYYSYQGRNPDVSYEEWIAIGDYAGVPHRHSNARWYAVALIVLALLLAMSDGAVRVLN